MPQKTTLTALQRFATLALLMFLLLVFYFPLGCAVGANGAIASSVTKEQQAESTGVIQPEFFGMVVRNAAARPAVATGARRLWDCGVTWAALEPAPGSFDWTTLDAEVAAAQQAGARITLTLGLTPAWASLQPSLPSSYGAGATAMPAHLADWDSYVAAVAARYRGRIDAYEVWNAPEDPAYWSGAPAQMGADLAALAAHTAAAVHGADPAALVVSPALSPAGLTAFLSSHGGESVDAIGTALLTGGQAPETMTETLQALRSALAGTAADGKPLWNDQGSWLLPQDGLDTATQAAWVARALLLHAGFAVGRMQWFAWGATGADSIQMTDAAGQLTLGAQAYGTVESWLSGAQVNGCASTAEGLWTCGLVRNGQTEWVLWTTSGTVQASALGESSVTDISGNQSSVGTDGTISVGASPELLR